tara:strand:- start:42 stop:920 length:879 start_codon:yes stop_codon:yes gene_type:complete
VRIEEQFDVSERRACAVTGQHRGTQRYQCRERSDEALLLAELERLVEENPGIGCRQITMLLQREGWSVNYKRVHRLWKREGYQVPQKVRKKKAIGVDANACNKRVATARNDIWTWDFIHDQTTDGRVIKFLVILDEHTRECLALYPARSIKSKDVLDILAKLIGERGAPKHIRSDNGTEFIARSVQTWLADLGVETLYIAPGAPWQNGYVESFNSRLRREFLAMNYFNNIAEARILATRWKEHYNTKRPQTALGKRTPEEFARSFGPSGSASLRSAPPTGPKLEGRPNTPKP